MAKKRSAEVTAVIRVNPRGFGFVEREGGDIFIPRGNLGGAVDGDRVTAVITGKSARGPEGRVTEIVERKHSHLAGTVRKRGKHGVWLFAPLLGPKMPVIVEGGNLKRGDRVVVKVENWGDEDFPTKCIFERKLGSIDDPSVDIPAACEEFSLPGPHPDMEAIPGEVGPSDLKGREDLRDLETVTIDPVTAKDFDDALSIQKTKQGYHLYIHIADVTHYVQPGSAIDLEARERCNSTYFPGTCIPMLPHGLADHLCSLRPDVDRLAVTVDLELGKQGEILEQKIYRSVIRSQRRFSYEEAREVLDGKLKSPHAKTLKLMVELCELFKAQRRERGSIEFALPEVVLKLDESGKPMNTHLVEYDITHQMVEEFMLKANEVVAKHLTDLGKALTYRVHEAPAGDDLEAFSNLARALGQSLPSTPTAADLQNLFDVVSQRAEGHLLAVAYIRSMKMAIYSTDNVGHYGLSLEHYCHFTSPIRRYPDLIVHRVLFGQGPEEEEIARIAHVCSEQERHSARAESSVQKLKKLRYLAQQKKRSEWKAVITQVKPFGISFEIKELMFEGFIHISELGNDYYDFDERSLSLRGRDSGEVIAIGAHCTVMLMDVDLIEREASWSLAGKV